MKAKKATKFYTLTNLYPFFKTKTKGKEKTFWLQTLVTSNVFVQTAALVHIL